MEINPQSDHIAVTIAGAGLAIATLSLAVWRAANFVRDMRDEVKGLRTDIRQAWTQRDQERWANELEKRNRDLPLDVPAVSDPEVRHTPI